MTVYSKILFMIPILWINQFMTEYVQYIDATLDNGIFAGSENMTLEIMEEIHSYGAPTPYTLGNIQEIQQYFFGDISHNDARHFRQIWYRFIQLKRSRRI